MKQNIDTYVITGISALTGERCEISGPMSYEIAMARLERENESRRRQKYAAYRKLRIEKRLPVQLTLKFEEL